MQSEHIILFEKYVINQLDDAEKANFEAKLAADPDFDNEFQTFKTLKAGIRLQAMQEKLSMLKHIDRQQTHEPSTRSNYTKYLIYLLGFFIISVIVYFATNTKQSNSENKSKITTDTISNSIQNIQIDTINKGFEELLIPKTDSTQHTVKPSAKDKIIIAESSKKSIWQEVISLYNRPESFAVVLRDTPTQKDMLYKEALQSFDKQEYTKVQSLLMNEEDEKSQNLLAHSYLLSQKTDQAAAIFRKMANDDFSVYHDEAKYYLVLSLLEKSKYHQQELSLLIDDLKDNPDYSDKINIIKAIIVK